MLSFARWCLHQGGCLVSWVVKFVSSFVTTSCLTNALCCKATIPVGLGFLHTCSYVVTLSRTDQLQRIKQNVQSFLELEMYLLNIARQDNDLLQCFPRCFLVSASQSRPVSSNCVLESRLLNRGSLPFSSSSYTHCHF